METLAQLRPPAVAGLFYPSDPDELRHEVEFFLSHAPAAEFTPRAIIVPHAGYVYSGEVAASAYSGIRALSKRIKRVALFGPCHRVPVMGMALSSAEAFSTPLGDVPLDVETIESLAEMPSVQYSDVAHAQEHSLEVQLPFLQTCLDNFTLVPIVVGDARAQDVGEVMELFWNDPHTLLVVSSDLSHYHDYETAQRIDRRTSLAIEHLQTEAIGYEQACGSNPIKGLLVLAKKHNLGVQTLDLRNSGDTAGSKDRVVGYGAYAVH